MTLHTLGNGFLSDENNISLGWQRESIFGASLEPNIRLQYVAGLNSQ